jgi:ribonuclease P protein component
MERKYRLRQSADFQRVRQEGRSWSYRLVTLCALRNNLEYSRFGFAVSRRVGKAVMRNRVRRRMREVVRLEHMSIVQGWDMVFVARPLAAQATYAEIASAIAEVLRQAGLRTTVAGMNDLARQTGR